MHIIADLKSQWTNFNVNFDFTLTAKSPLGVFGPSGSGKSTLLKALAGLNPDITGHIVVNDQIWQDSSQKIYVPTYARSIGYVPQSPVIFPHMTALDNILYGYNRTPKDQRKINLTEVTELLKLNDLYKRPVQSLSGGQKQRLCLARSLLMSPAWLLLDEPLSSLDGFAQKEIVSYLKQIHSEFKIPMIYVSHSVREILEISNTVMLLENGAIARIAPTSELRQDLLALQSW